MSADEPLEDQCVLCKKEAYLHPTMKLKQSICGHQYCDACLTLQFQSQLVLFCKICNAQLRKANFHEQGSVGGAQSKELSVRKKIEAEFNKRVEDFGGDTNRFNDYLETREDIIYNLVNGIDVAETQAQVERNRAENRALIVANAAKKAAEDDLLQKQVDVERQQWTLRREMFLQQDQRERLVRLRAEAEFLHGLSSGKDVSELETKLRARTAQARDEAKEMLLDEQREAEEQRRIAANAEAERAKKLLQADAELLKMKAEQRTRKRVIGANLKAPLTDMRGLLGKGQAPETNNDDKMQEDKPPKSGGSEAADNKKSVPKIALKEENVDPNAAIFAGGWQQSYFLKRVREEAFDGLQKLLNNIVAAQE